MDPDDLRDDARAPRPPDRDELHRRRGARRERQREAAPVERAGGRTDDEDASLAHHANYQVRLVIRLQVFLVIDNANVQNGGALFG